MPVAIRIVRIAIVYSVPPRPDLGPSNSIDFHAIRELRLSVTWQNSFVRVVRVGSSMRVMVTRVLVCPAAFVVYEYRRVAGEHIVRVRFRTWWVAVVGLSPGLSWLGWLLVGRLTATVTAT